VRDQRGVAHTAAQDTEPGAVATGHLARYEFRQHPVATAPGSVPDAQSQPALDEPGQPAATRLSSPLSAEARERHGTESSPPLGVSVAAGNLRQPSVGERQPQGRPAGEIQLRAPSDTTSEVIAAAALRPALRAAARVTAELRSAAEPVAANSVAANGVASGVVMLGVEPTALGDDPLSPAPPSERDFTPAPAADETFSPQTFDAAPRSDARPVETPLDASAARGTGLAALPAASDSDAKTAAAATDETGSGARVDAPATAAKVSRVEPQGASERRQNFAGEITRRDAPQRPQPARGPEASRPLEAPHAVAQEGAAVRQSPEVVKPAPSQPPSPERAAEAGLPRGGDESPAPPAAVARGGQSLQAEAGQPPRVPLDGAGAFHTPQTVVAQTVNRIIGAAESVARRETRTLRLELKPEHLGRVEVELTRGGEGGLRAHLTAERGEAGHALQESIGQLRESLERAGVTVERLEVNTRPSLSDAAGSQQHRHAPEHTPPASRPHARGGGEQPEADDAPRAVREEGIISLRA
jgi:flagellar hook-length control protein FliK